MVTLQEAIDAQFGFPVDIQYESGAANFVPMHSQARSLTVFVLVLIMGLSR